MVSEPDVQDPRIIATNVIINGFKIRLVNAYSPTNTDGSIAQKDDFYRKLRKACINKERNFKLVVAGDFNAITSIVLRQSFFDGKKFVEDESSNDNGNRLKSFCRFQKLCMPQTYYEHSLENRYTWYSNDGITKRVLDYILVEDFVQQYIENCVVDTNYDFDSDHRLLITTMNTPTTKQARSKQRKQQIKKLDINSLNQQETQIRFLEALSNSLESAQTECTLKERAEKVTQALNTAAKNSLPNKMNNKTCEIWKDDQLLNNLSEQRTRENIGTHQHKELSKRIKKRVNETGGGSYLLFNTPS